MKLTAETDHRNPEMRGAGTGLRATPISARTLRPVTASLFALAVILLSCGTGCSTGKILTSTNNWAYYTARVNEAPEPCRHAALQRWLIALDEVNAASKRGGSFPLQLKALRDAETKFGECKP